MEKFITQKIFADTDPADEQELKLETGLNINTLKFILMDEAVIILFSHPCSKGRETIKNRREGKSYKRRNCGVFARYWYRDGEKIQRP